MDAVGELAAAFAMARTPVAARRERSGEQSGGDDATEDARLTHHSPHAVSQALEESRAKQRAPSSIALQQRASSQRRSLASPAVHELRSIRKSHIAVPLEHDVDDMIDDSIRSNPDDTPAASSVQLHRIPYDPVPDDSKPKLCDARSD